MVLGETLTDARGASPPDGRAAAAARPVSRSRRRHLGYRAATCWRHVRSGVHGARFRGHEFHYASIVEEGSADPLFAVSDASGNDLGHAGLRRGPVAGSFIHLIDEAD